MCLIGFRISSSHIFSYSDTKRWRTTETASGFVRVYDGYVPKIQNFNLPARTTKTVYQKIYEAAEMGICPNSNVEFEAYEGVAIVFQIGEQCNTEEMIFDRSIHPSNPNQVDAKPRKFRVSISFRDFLCPIPCKLTLGNFDFPVPACYLYGIGYTV